MKGFIFLVWIFSGFVAAFIALKKGEGPLASFQALVLGPVGLWLAILYAGDHVLCPSCKRQIHPSASICPYCLREISR